MKTPSRFKLRMVGVGILLLGAGTIALRQNTLAGLRDEQQRLVVESRDAERLLAENKEIPRLQAEHNEVEKLREDNRDLPRLRNQVRQLHRQLEGLGQLRTEHERLTGVLQTVSAAPESAAKPEGLILKDALINAGFATPEATVQTYFWAMCQGNAARAVDCLAIEEDADDPTARQTQKERLIKDEAESIGKFGANFHGFRILERRESSPEGTTLYIQSSVGGEPLPMTLVRVGAEWKLKM